MTAKKTSRTNELREKAWIAAEPSSSRVKDGCREEPSGFGPPQWLTFTGKDGTPTRRFMRPVLDDQGAWTSWVPAEDPVGPRAVA